MSTEKKSYVLPIAIMFLLFFMIAFVTGFQNPMGVIVKNQFGASNFLSQLGNFANFIAYACMGIPAGIMLTKIGYKKTALVAVTIGFVGVGITFLSGVAESFGVYLLGAFVSGFSMCLLNTVVNLCLIHWVAVEKRKPVATVWWSHQLQLALPWHLCSLVISWVPLLKTERSPAPIPPFS